MNQNVEEYIAFKDGKIRMPSHLRSRKEEKGRLHENDLVEKITTTPIYVPQILWFVVIILFLWLSLVKTATTITVRVIELVTIIYGITIYRHMSE